MGYTRFLTFASLLVILFGFYFKNFVFMFIGQALSGFFCYMIPPIMFELITQHTYPTDELFVMYWFTLINQFFSISRSEIARLFFIYGGGLGVLTYMSALAFNSFLLSFAIKSKYKRLEFEDTEKRSILQNND